MDKVFKNRWIFFPITLGLFAWLWAGALWAQTTSQLRFLSFSIQDRAPSRQEVESYLNGELSLDQLVKNWLDSPAHLKRMERYFRDMFGYNRSLRAIHRQFVLRYNKDSDYYYLWTGDHQDCSAEEVVSSSAWWLEPGQTVRICRQDTSESLDFYEEGVRTPCNARNMGDLRCGCGPELIQCIPSEYEEELRSQLDLEFARHAVRTYAAGGNWEEIFLYSTFFGTRLLYWKYLSQIKMARAGMQPSELEWEALKSLSTDIWSEKPYPLGEAQAGVLTSPAFLIQHNNYRTRVKELALRVLCQPISAELNTAGIEEFLNPDFTEKDLEHANQEFCSRCHYPMDNLGSMLFGWNADGEWDPLETELSNVGFAFGEKGRGAKFLLRRTLQKGPGFNECMARTAWEDLTRTYYDGLDDSIKQSLTSLAARGPQVLMQGILKSSELKNLRPYFTQESEQDEPTVSDQSETAAEGVEESEWQKILPIVEATCAGSTCHSPGSFNATYLGARDNLVRDAEVILARLAANDNTRMPPMDSANPLSEADREVLKQFFQLFQGEEAEN